MKYFQISELESKVWPKGFNSSQLSIGAEEDGVEDGSTVDVGGGMSRQGSQGIIEGKQEVAIELPASMIYARSLLDEVKDPLGVNDSLYQYNRL